VKASVVIAAYNERENIETLTRRLDTALRGLTDWQTEILYVIDGTDGTMEIVERLANEIPNLRFLYSEKPSGLGAAFRRGFAAVTADADYVATMDADLNHQPEEIPRLLEAAVNTHADIVVGSRWADGSTVTGTPLWKRALSAVGNVVLRYIWGLRVRDKTSGFRVYRAETLRKISFRNHDFAFLPEILIHASRRRMTIREEPIRFVYRTAGRSKMNLWRTAISYILLLHHRSKRPL
jgi:dolichol-phosphate mannosyltransferase